MVPVCTEHTVLQRMIQFLNLFPNRFNIGFELCDKIIPELVISLFLRVFNLLDISGKLYIRKSMKFTVIFLVIFPLRVIRHSVFLVVFHPLSPPILFMSLHNCACLVSGTSKTVLQG